MRWLQFLAASTAAVVIAGCSTSRPLGASGPAQRPFTVKIIALNDYHGNLEPSGAVRASAPLPLAEQTLVGGADYLAAHVRKLKARNPLNVVVGAGDVIGASPPISSAFHDEPSVETLNRIGLEFNAAGNHEFDHGAAELLRLQQGGCKTSHGRIEPNSCMGAKVGTPVPFEGARFQWLAANVVSASSGETLLPPYGVKTFNGVKIAFIGMTLKSTPTMVTPTGVAGLEFRDEAQTVNALVPELRRQGVESIIVLLHQGGRQTGTRPDINGCEGNLAGSAIAGIVQQLDDAVDMVISGHTHAAYICTLANAQGRGIPVTSAGAYGRVLTDIDVTLDPATGDITAVKAMNRPVSRSDPSVRADAAIARIVAGYKDLVAPLADKVIGTISAPLPNSRSDGACNMPAGNLIADAQLYATSASNAGGAQIAFINGGGVRSPGFVFGQGSGGARSGEVTFGQALTVQPFGNSLVTMTLTALDLKEVLEEQFAGCHGQTATATRFMTPSAGFKYTWDGAKACNARISNVTLTRGGVTETIVDANGKVVNPVRRYRVAVNNFMADGGDGYATFLKGTDRKGGPQDIEALIAFLARHNPQGSPYDAAGMIEDGGTPRVSRIGSGMVCPTGSDVNP